MLSQNAPSQWQSRFPPELVDNVIDEVAALENTSSHSTYSCLRSLALVNKAWVSRTRHHAFSSVTLRLRDRDDVCSYITTLQDARGVAGYIQRLKLDGGEDQLGITVSDIHRLLQTLPNLHVLVLFSIFLNFADPSPSMDIKTSYKLDELSLREVSVRHDIQSCGEHTALEDLLSLFRNINHLELDYVTQKMWFMRRKIVPSGTKPRVEGVTSSIPAQLGLSGTTRPSRTIGTLIVKRMGSQFKDLQQAFSQCQLSEMVLQPPRYDDLFRTFQFSNSWPFCQAEPRSGHEIGQLPMTSQETDSIQAATPLSMKLVCDFNEPSSSHPESSTYAITEFLEAINPSTRRITLKLNLFLWDVEDVGSIDRSAGADALRSRACIDGMTKWLWDSSFSSLRRFHQLEGLHFDLFSYDVRSSGMRKLQHITDLPRIEEVDTELAKLHKEGKFSASWWSAEATT